MKKLFLVALSATLLAASCQKTEIINPVGDPVMLFTTNMGKLTKAPNPNAPDAENEGLVNLKLQNFRVWAYAAEDYDNTPGNDLNQIYDGMENLQVSFKNDAWGTDKQYFWPGVDKNLNFFAVSADDATVGEMGKTSEKISINVAERSITIKDFVVEHRNQATTESSPATTAANVDLMVADFVKQNQAQDEKKVNLKFHHALSKVEFVFNTNPADDIKVFVQSLEVTDLETTGTLTVTPKSTTVTTGEGEDDETTKKPAEVTQVEFTWEQGKSEGPAQTATPQLQTFTDDWFDVATTGYPDSYEFAAGVTVHDETAMILTANPQKFTTWLMLPQTITNKKVKITYLINNRQFVSEFPLDKGISEWDDNQYIKYNINLSPNLISFDATVDDWNPKDGQGIDHNN